MAAALSSKVVPFVMLAIVALAGMPVPVIVMPGWRPAVLATVTVVVVEVLPPVRRPKPPPKLSVVLDGRMFVELATVVKLVFGMAGVAVAPKVSCRVLMRSAWPVVTPAEPVWMVVEPV